MIKDINKCYRPYDIISDKSGNVGFIQEVDINENQNEFKHQVSYCVIWLVGEGVKNAWYNHSELTKHCNLFVEIAKASCHPFGNNEFHVNDLFNCGNFIQ